MIIPGKSLLVSSACLAASLAVVVRLAAAEQEQPAPAQGKDPQLADPALLQRRVLDPVAAYSVVAERPLMSPSRRPAVPTAPPPPAPVAPAAAPAPLLPRPGPLLAVLIGPGQHMAILKHPDGRVSTIVEGESIGAWTLEKVLPDRVVLHAGVQVTELGFPVHNGAGPTPTPAPVVGPVSQARRRR